MICAVCWYAPQKQLVCTCINCKSTPPPALSTYTNYESQNPLYIWFLIFFGWFQIFFQLHLIICGVEWCSSRWVLLHLHSHIRTTPSVRFCVPCDVQVFTWDLQVSKTKPWELLNSGNLLQCTQANESSISSICFIIYTEHHQVFDLRILYAFWHIERILAMIELERLWNFHGSFLDTLPVHVSRKGICRCPDQYLRWPAMVSETLVG